MNIKSIQTKLKLILLTLLNVSALNSPAFAEYLIVDGISVSGSNKTYEAIDDGWTSALNVFNNGSYTGINITLSSTFGQTSNRWGAYVTGGQLSLTGGSITASGYIGNGIFIGAGSGTINNVTIETTGTYGHGVNLQSSATLTLIDCDIITTGYGANTLDVFLSSTATARLNGNTLAGGLNVDRYSTLTLTGSNGTVITGNVISNENSAIDITLSGSATQLIGTATHDADSTINLTIDNGTQLNQLTGDITTLTLQNGATLSSDDDGLLLNGAAITVTTDLLALSGGAILDFNGSSPLSLGGTLTIGDGIQIDFSGITVEDNDEFLVLDWSSASLTGEVNAEDFIATNLGPDMGGTFTVANNQLTFNASAIPEPATYFLLGAGLGLLLLAARCRRKVQTGA